MSVTFDCRREHAVDNNRPHVRAREIDAIEDCAGEGCRGMH